MKKIKWNEGWNVWKEDNAFRLVQAVPKHAITVDLPYDPMFLQPQDPESRNLGKTGFLNGGTWNFYKELYVGEEEKGMDFRLLFEGSACNTYVFVNENMVQSHSYAYAEFYVDIASYLNYGKNNRILVVCTTLDEASRFYNGCGLYRDVYVLKGNRAVIEPESIRITTEMVDGDLALLQLDVDFKNEENYRCTADLALTISDAAGKVIKVQNFPVHLKGECGTHYSRKFSVKGILPWSAEEPNLYTIDAVLTGENGEVLDTDQIHTGFRVVTVDAVNGLRINGREVNLLGGCIHHDQGILGAATYDSYEYRRVLKLKEAGFNAVRCAHNPASKALLRACDRLGMYVLDETFDMWGRMKNIADFSLWFEKEYRNVVETMVKVDYNHPSVVMYSIGNEIMDVATVKGLELAYDMTGLFHQLDKTRSVTNALNAFLAANFNLVDIAADITGTPAEEILKQDVNEFIATHRSIEPQLSNHEIINQMLERLDGATDVIGYNYLPDRYDPDCAKYPDRIILGTETHAKRIVDQWRGMCEHKNIIGDFIWTSYSYLGETGGKNNFPRLQNESCDVDMIGELRPTNYYRKLIIGQRTDPYIAVRSPEQSEQPMRVGPWSLTDAENRWCFDNAEGREVDVEVYFAGDEAELFVGDVSCGRKTDGAVDREAFGGMEPRTVAAAPGVAYFRIPYTAKTLTAVSYKDGAENGRYSISPAPAGALSAAAEEYPCNDDLCFVRVTAQNAEGDVVFKTIDELKIEVEGEAQLLAFGSYNTPHGDGYQQKTIKVYSGAALAIFKKKGGAKVTFTAEGLESCSVEI